MINRYLSLILKLLPSGIAWNKEKDSNITKLCDGISQEFERVDSRATSLLSEINPTKTNELLGDFENMLALPDSSLGTPESILERRALIQLKMSLRGGQSRSFYIKLMESLGFEVGIIEYRPFRAGQSSAGNSITNGNDWIHAWTIALKEAIVYYFRAGQSAAGEQLVLFKNDIVQSAISKYKPAHTKTLFSYIEG